MLGRVRLVLLRHATAAPRGSSDHPDSERPLVAEGEAEARHAGRALRRLGMLPFLQSVDLDEASQIDQDGAKLKKFVIRGQIDYGAPATAVARGGAAGKPAGTPGAGGAR